MSPGPHPLLHGYDVHGDLAQHYRFPELVLTALRGEAPTRAEGELYDAVLSFWCPIGAAHAPVHAVVLARTCGARDTSVLAVGAAPLAGQASQIIEDHEALLSWLSDPSAPFPEALRGPPQPEREAVRSFARRVEPTGIPVPALEHGAWACGLRSRTQLAATIVSARYPLMLSAAVHEPEGAFRGYPIDLPHFDYHPPEDGESP